MLYDWLYFLFFFLLKLSLDIMNGSSYLAWDLYLKMETSAESFNLLHLIANDCYKVLIHLGFSFSWTFFCGTNRWELFTSLQKHSMFWNVWILPQNIGWGSVGRVLACSNSWLQERSQKSISGMLLQCSETRGLLKCDYYCFDFQTNSNPQVDSIIKIIKKWSRENNMKI